MSETNRVRDEGAPDTPVSLGVVLVGTWSEPEPVTLNDGTEATVRRRQLKPLGVVSGGLTFDPTKV